MNPSSFQSETKQTIEVDWVDRWQVYRRLQELSISCQCGSNQPLTVQIDDVKTAVQVWSVVRQITVPRWGLVGWLERCWCD
ncbi:MAG: hypothetical protein KME06_01490 [Kastovskya adunca ATA6-11-RM4]|nr:hypothetical protein [Kastovskya adunca ATA6-11-RM4]